MRKLWIFIFLLVGTFFAAQAQEFTYGFKAGLNFGKFVGGTSETDNAGTSLEETSYGTGFHVGAIGNLSLTDYFGLRAELLYSQKGSDYKFVGPSYFIFPNPTGGRIVATGSRDMLIDVTNSYIDLPLLGYAKFGRFEIMAGANVAFLISSSGDGGISFSGQTLTGEPVSMVNFNADYNFIGDKPGEGIGSELITVTIAGQPIEVPQTLGAYYEFANDPGNLYNRFDLGLIGGVSFYLNNGLYINGRINYGLTDVTNNDVDVSLTTLNNANFINRSDDDRNFVIQTSIGFRF